MSDYEWFKLADEYGGIAAGIIFLTVLIIMSSWHERRNIIFLTFPLWGTAIFMKLICATKNDGLGYIGLIMIATSALPIFESKNLSNLSKVILTFAYYAISSVAMFLIGWWLACQH